MTVHTWTTSGDVPPAAWAAMGTDMATLLGSWQTVGGATVTGPAGSGAAQLDAETIAFAVALPAPAAPLSITFARAAGTGRAETNGHITDGLVVLALIRAGRHFGALLSWTSDAGTAARAVAAVYAEHLFGAGDRALAGQSAQVSVDPAAQTAGICSAAQARVAAGPAATTALDTVGFLAALIADLTAEHDGRVTAAALLST